MALKDKIRENQVIQNRLKIIAPLIQGLCDGKDREKIIADICKKNDISRKTVLRYYNCYMNCLKTGDMSGLAPKGRPDVVPKIPESVVNRAIELRMESPNRSLDLVIAIMEGEGLVKKGEIKRTTLQDAMAKKGYTAKSTRTRNEDGGGSTRFEKQARNELWMGDILYGPTLKEKGKVVKTYLSVILDDFSRHIIYAHFYDNMSGDIVVDSLRRAFEKYGTPLMVYFDNGKQYCGDQVKNCCGMLGVAIAHCKPRHAASKGKVEKVQELLRKEVINEFDNNKTNSLDDLNLRLDTWIEKRYEHKIHSATKETPYDRYYGDTEHPLRFVDPTLLDFSFYNVATRVANKCGEISFGGRSFFAGREAASREVVVLYKTKNDDVIHIRYEETMDWQECRPTKVGPFVTKTTKKTEKENIAKRSDFLTELIKEDNPDYVPPRDPPEDATSEETATDRSENGLSEKTQTAKGKQMIKYEGFEEEGEKK